MTSQELVESRKGVSLVGGLRQDTPDFFFFLTQKIPRVTAGSLVNRNIEKMLWDKWKQQILRTETRGGKLG